MHLRKKTWDEINLDVAGDAAASKTRPRDAEQTAVDDFFDEDTDEDMEEEKDGEKGEAEEEEEAVAAAAMAAAVPAVVPLPPPWRRRRRHTLMLYGLGYIYTYLVGIIWQQGWRCNGHMLWRWGPKGVCYWGWRSCPRGKGRELCCFHHGVPTPHSVRSTRSRLLPAGSEYRSLDAASRNS